MGQIEFSNGQKTDPEELVYVALSPTDETEAFNEDVWNYVRKGDDVPTLMRVKAADVAVGELIYNPEGVAIARRIG